METNRLSTPLGSGVVGVGIDLVEVPRLERALLRTPSLAERLFTAGEQDWCVAGRHPVQRYGARFAAKEAAMKALGVGLGAVGWWDLEVVRAEDGSVSLSVTGRAAILAADRGGASWLVSLTHTGTTAGAVVVLSS